MLSDCIFTPSDSDEEYADSWFNWDWPQCGLPFFCWLLTLKTLYMSKIKLYISYRLLMLCYYPYRKLFPNEIATLKESFKIISHPELYDSATVSANYTIFVTTNNVLHEMVEEYKRIRKNRYWVHSIATKAAHRRQIRHSCQPLGEVKEELV